VYRCRGEIVKKYCIVNTCRPPDFLQLAAVSNQTEMASGRPTGSCEGAFEERNRWAVHHIHAMPPQPSAVARMMFRMPAGPTKRPTTIAAFTSPAPSARSANGTMPTINANPKPWSGSAKLPVLRAKLRPINMPIMMSQLGMRRVRRSANATAPAHTQSRGAPGEAINIGSRLT